MTREDMYKLQKKEDGYWLIINLPKHKQSGVFRLSTNLHNEKAENLGFLKGILDTAIEEQETRPEPTEEAERAYEFLIRYGGRDLVKKDTDARKFLDILYAECGGKVEK